MKLICLNIWGGTMYKPLMEFITEQSRDTDIFCFQEVLDTPTTETTSQERRVNILRELMLALPDFVSYFAPTQDNFDLVEFISVPISFGEAVFIRRSFVVREHGAIFVRGARNSATAESRDFPTALQYVRPLVEKTPLTIYNFHGLVPPSATRAGGNDPKLDTPDRIEQARRIRTVLDADHGPKILCGDFNLRPDTESMHITKGKDLRNLIEDYHITDTRGPLLKIPTNPTGNADHMLISAEITVNDFHVPSLAISDHLPLILTFDIQ